ncbi:hypothetical protein KR222_009570, partial [Zaprionus bogoriensis]
IKIFIELQLAVKMKSLIILLALTSIGLYLAEEHKPDCTVNGTIADCPSSTPETCRANPGKYTEECIGPCVCKEGYIINTDIPACVLRADCPAYLRQFKGVEYVTNFPYFGKSYD